MRKQKQATRQGSQRERQRQSGSQEMSDLKSREYRDAQGNIHHHTRKWMEQHRSEMKRGESKRGESKRGESKRGESKRSKEQ